MSGAQFIKDAPVWVWILLVFLIQRGINALSDREMRIERLFLLPLLFLVWGVYSVIHETANTGIALAVMLVGLIIGMAAGWGLWRYILGRDSESVYCMVSWSPKNDIIALSLSFLQCRYAFGQARRYSHRVNAQTDAPVTAFDVFFKNFPNLWGRCGADLPNNKKIPTFSYK